MLADDIPFDAPVLVAVINRPADLERARQQGWYRIPVRRAPPMLAVSYLAFYQTSSFGDERWAVRYCASVQRVGVALRRELLPDEADHPRAGERYYRFALGPLWALPVPVPSRRLRRVTFIPTTFGQLLHARELTELWQPAAHQPDDGPWAAGVNQRMRRRG